MNNKTTKLLRQHLAILQSSLDTVARVTDSMSADAAELDAVLEVCGSAEVSIQEALDTSKRAQERARVADAKLSQAIADLRFVMGGGDPCKVCSNKCLMGESTCKPVWHGEDGAQ